MTSFMVVPNLEGSLEKLKDVSKIAKKGGINDIFLIGNILGDVYNDQATSRVSEYFGVRSRIPEEGRGEGLKRFVEERFDPKVIISAYESLKNSFHSQINYFLIPDSHYAEEVFDKSSLLHFDSKKLDEIAIKGLPDTEKKHRHIPDEYQPGVFGYGRSYDEFKTMLEFLDGGELDVLIIGGSLDETIKNYLKEKKGKVIIKCDDEVIEMPNKVFSETDGFSIYNFEGKEFTGREHFDPKASKDGASKTIKLSRQVIVGEQSIFRKYKKTTWVAAIAAVALVGSLIWDLYYDNAQLKQDIKGKEAQACYMRADVLSRDGDYQGALEEIKKHPEVIEELQK